MTPILQGAEGSPGLGQMPVVLVFCHLPQVMSGATECPQSYSAQPRSGDLSVLHALPKRPEIGKVRGIFPYLTNCSDLLGQAPLVRLGR